jgi:hypothetical protein
MDKIKPDEITVDLGNMLIGDIVLFGRLQRKEATQVDLVEFLTRVCGDDVLRVPIQDMAAIVDRISSAMSEAGNPKAAA